MVPYFVVPGVFHQIEGRLPDSYVVLAASLMVSALWIWGSTELYLLKGTPSSNLFGPNPLGKQQARPRSTENRLRATTAYDQASEIELVPLMGSPPSSMHVKRGA